ncbi:MAG: substrate-binding domain-containing protein [Hyphomicrobiales bacterium]|nr:substrate-binding domain-containing protein [Hyphomicrobiales bacterium]
MRKLGLRLLALLLLISTAPARAEAITVMCSGGFTAALEALTPVYTRQFGDSVRIVLGPSMGTSPTAIPERLRRGEAADVVIMVGSALDALAADRVVIAATRVDLADSRIAMAVKAGAAKPDISTVENFKKALREAKSIAYSDSASGVYIEREMYQRLGLAAELQPKSRMIVAERVGDVVGRGQAEIGFQQLSELKASKGAEIVGLIPEAVQKITPFSAAVSSRSAAPKAATAFIQFLASPAARAAIVESGLDPRGK